MVSLLQFKRRLTGEKHSTSSFIYVPQEYKDVLHTLSSESIKQKVPVITFKRVTEEGSWGLRVILRHIYTVRFRWSWVNSLHISYHLRFASHLDALSQDSIWAKNSHLLASSCRLSRWQTWLHSKLDLACAAVSWSLDGISSNDLII